MMMLPVICLILSNAQTSVIIVIVGLNILF